MRIFLIRECFFRNVYKGGKNLNTVCFWHVYVNSVLNWKSHVYSAGFLLFLASEVCRTERAFGSSPCLRDALFKATVLPDIGSAFQSAGRTPSPACAGDAAARSEGVIGRSGPVFRLPLWTKVCGQRRMVLTLSVHGKEQTRAEKPRKVWFSGLGLNEWDVEVGLPLQQTLDSKRYCSLLSSLFPWHVWGLSHVKLSQL